MAKSCGPMESKESPKDEAREHSASFLKSAVRAKGGNNGQSRYNAMRKVGRSKAGR